MADTTRNLAKSTLDAYPIPTQGSGLSPSPSHTELTGFLKKQEDVIAKLGRGTRPFLRNTTYRGLSTDIKSPRYNLVQSKVAKQSKPVKTKMHDVYVAREQAKIDADEGNQIKQ